SFPAGRRGGTLCWRIAANEKAGGALAGLILLGSLWDEVFSNHRPSNGVCRFFSCMEAAIRFSRSTSRKVFIVK
ncbi:hypothetical protein K3V46_14700, partial [Listeria monocytogenes]|nr:hypothetical protein [Listeria monocytogenes]